jgi:hypothetical protein
MLTCRDIFTLSGNKDITSVLDSVRFYCRLAAVESILAAAELSSYKTFRSGQILEWC